MKGSFVYTIQDIIHDSDTGQYPETPTSIPIPIPTTSTIPIPSPIPSTIPIPTPTPIPITSPTSTFKPTSRPEILYQYSPRRGTPDDLSDWVYSLESYQKKARREYHLLVNNYKTDHVYRICGINYWREFFIEDILDKFSQIKDYLREHGVVAYTIVEVTDDEWGKPSNRLHYHLIVDSLWSERRLRVIFNGACRSAGLQPEKDCRVFIDEPILDPKTFASIVKYLLKYDKKYLNVNCKDGVILFRPGTGINKVDQINQTGPTRQWVFAKEDGRRANKEVEWRAIVTEWYSAKIRLRLWGTLQTGGETFQFGNGNGVILKFPPPPER